MSENSNPINGDKKRAVALLAQGHYAEAEWLCRQSIDADKKDAGAHHNLGVVLARQERFEEAIIHYRTAVGLDPKFAPAYTNLGFCLNAMNLVAEARAAFAEAHELSPDNPVPILNEGIAALSLGDYAAGWRGFGARWQLPSYADFHRHFAGRIWHGEDICGKTLLLHAEQGLGDVIQMARFIPLLAARNVKIVAVVQPALQSLLCGLHVSCDILVVGAPLPAFDLYCPMMDVPRFLGVTLESIPATTPYLFADPAQIERYRRLFPPASARRVGVVWAGRATNDNDHNRSLNLAQLAPLFTEENIAWVSLQTGVSDIDAAILDATGALNLGNGFEDFSATAAAIMALDLVITVDTATAHLAGALGKPVWVLLPFHADWRWLMERDDSPWYPTARLFRQPCRGDWGSVIKAVRAALAEKN